MLASLRWHGNYIAHWQCYYCTEHAAKRISYSRILKNVEIPNMAPRLLTVGGLDSGCWVSGTWDFEALNTYHNHVYCEFGLILCMCRLDTGSYEE